MIFSRRPFTRCYHRYYFHLPRLKKTTISQLTELYYVKIHSISLLDFHIASTADHIRLLQLQRRAAFPNSRYYRLRISEHDR